MLHLKLLYILKLFIKYFYDNLNYTVVVLLVVNSFHDFLLISKIQKCTGCPIKMGEDFGTPCTWLCIIVNQCRNLVLAISH